MGVSEVREKEAIMTSGEEGKGGGLQSKSNSLFFYREEEGRASDPLPELVESINLRGGEKDQVFPLD